jgi:aminocarboxymuconate-semialdehyde decarboxylase
MSKAAKKRKKTSVASRRPARAKSRTPPRAKTTSTRAKAKSARAKATRAKAKTRPKGPAPKPIVIDFHAHTVIPELLAFAYEKSMFAKRIATGAAGGRAPGLPEEFERPMTNMARRLGDMDQMGVDIQVVSPSILHQCTYFAEPEEALKMERLGNERIAEMVSRHPDRLVGLGSVPLQDALLASEELTRCVEDLKLKGVIISSHVNGIELGDARLRPFWAKAEQLGCVVFIHPAGSTDERMRKHRLLITLGQPLEEAFAMSSLVYEGIIDEFPTLKIAFAHGGGFLPFYTGRHDMDYRFGRGGANLKGDFSSYLPRFWYDTVLFNPDMLEFLLTKVPASHVILASDYPFAEKRPVEFVRRATKISRKDQDAILGANCATLLGMSI